MESLLQAILDELRSQNQPLGFFDNSRSVVYINRTQCPPYLWYTREGEVNTGIPVNSLRGIILGVAVESVERRGKSTSKIRVRVQSDRMLVLEVGLESQAGLSLSKSLYSLGQTKQPVVLTVSAGDDESVVFVRASLQNKQTTTAEPIAIETAIESLVQWYPDDKLFKSNAGDSQSQNSPQPQPEPAAPKRSMYDWLTERLSQIGLWQSQDWQNWVNKTITENGFTRETLTLEMASQIFKYCEQQIAPTGKI